MSLGTSFAPLLNRIREVLNKGAGSSRTLAREDRFTFGLHPFMDAAEAKKLILSTPHPRGYWATIEEAESGDAPDAASDRAGYRITVRIDVLYTSSQGLRRENWHDTIARATDDMHRVRAALEAGNLAQDENGDHTGLASDRLMMVGWSLGDPNPDADTLPAEFRFQGHVTLSQPT